MDSNILCIASSINRLADSLSVAFHSKVLYSNFPSSGLLVTAATATAADENQDDQQQDHTDEDEEDGKRGFVPVRPEEVFGLQSGKHIVELILNLVSNVSQIHGCKLRSTDFLLFFLPGS